MSISIFAFAIALFWGLGSGTANAQTYSNYSDNGYCTSYQYETCPPAVGCETCSNNTGSVVYPGYPGTVCPLVSNGTTQCPSYTYQGYNCNAGSQCLVYVGSDASNYTSYVYSEINQIRSNNGESQLDQNSVLAEVAQNKADSMAEGSYVSADPAATVQSDLQNYYQGYYDNGYYTYSSVAENVSYRVVVEGYAWNPAVYLRVEPRINRETIINTDATDVGVGVAFGEYDNQPVIFVAEVFATPTEQQTYIQTSYPYHQYGNYNGYGRNHERSYLMGM